MKHKGYPPTAEAKANAKRAIAGLQGVFALNKNDYLIFRVLGGRYSVACVGDDHYVALKQPVVPGVSATASNGKVYRVTADLDLEEA